MLRSVHPTLAGNIYTNLLYLAFLQENILKAGNNRMDSLDEYEYVESDLQRDMDDWFG